MKTSEEETVGRGIRRMQARDWSPSSPPPSSIWIHVRSREARKVKIKREKVEKKKNHSRLDINFEWIKFHCLTFCSLLFHFFMLVEKETFLVRKLTFRKSHWSLLHHRVNQNRHQQHFSSPFRLLLLWVDVMSSVKSPESIEKEKGFPLFPQRLFFFLPKICSLHASELII